MNTVTSQRQEPATGMTRRSALVVIGLTVAAIGVNALLYVRPFSITNGTTTIAFGPFDDANTADDIDVDAAVAGGLADRRHWPPATLTITVLALDPFEFHWKVD